MTAANLTDEALVRASFQAFKDGDRAAQEKLLATDFTFTSPYDDAINKAAYFERCGPNKNQIKAFEIELVMAKDGGVFVTYLVTTQNDSTSRNTEFHTVKNGQITSVNVYFGASYTDGKFKGKAPE